MAIAMSIIDQPYQEDRAAHPPGHPRILALANQKGGVGKTTTAINLGTALAAIGERVLIVDLDPQGNASTGLGIDRKSRNTSTYDVLVGEAPLQSPRRPNSAARAFWRSPIRRAASAKPRPRSISAPRSRPSARKS